MLRETSTNRSVRLLLPSFIEGSTALTWPFGLESSCSDTSLVIVMGEERLGTMEGF